MEDDRDRSAAIAGFVFVVLFLVMALLPGAPPKASDRASEVADWVADQGRQIRWAGFAGGLAMVPFVFWLVAVMDRVRGSSAQGRRLAQTAALGGVAGMLMASTAAVLLGVMAIVGPTGSADADSMRTLYVTGNNLGFMSLFGLALMLAGTSLAAMKSQALPTWLNRCALGVAVLGLFAGAATASTRDVFVIVGLIAFVGTLVWVVVVSALMLRPAAD